MQYTAAPWMPRAGAPAHGIVFLDEFRQAGHDVQKPAAELLLNGRVGDSKLPPGWMVVAASNRESDRSGVQRELAFVSNRRMEIKVSPDLESWVDWAERKAIHWAAIAFAKAHPGKIFSDKVPDKPGPFTTPRSFVKMSYLIGELPMEMFTEAAAGMIGEGSAAEFVSFLRFPRAWLAFLLVAIHLPVYRSEHRPVTMICCRNLTRTWCPPIVFPEILSACLTLVRQVRSLFSRWILLA